MSEKHKGRRKPASSRSPQNKGQATPALAVYGQAYSWGGIGLACLAFAWAARVKIDGESGIVAMVIGILFAAVFLLVCLLLLWLAKTQAASVRSLLGREKVAQWEIPDPEWQAFLQQERRRLRWVIPFMTLLGVLFGLFVGYVLDSGGASPMESTGATYLLAAAVGAGTGFIVGAFFIYVGNLPHRLASRHPGQVIFGQDGYYLPGTYRAWMAPGDRIRSAEIAGNGSDGRSLFVLNYWVRAKHGYRTAKYYLPIPPGREADAQRVLEWINGKYS